MALATIALLAGLVGAPPCCTAPVPAALQPLASLSVAVSASQDPVKPKSGDRPARAPEGRTAEPRRAEPSREPSREPRREQPKAEPAGRGVQRDADRPKSTGEPELRRRKP